eukprot:4650074-Prymnesium_polylepis.1
MLCVHYHHGGTIQLFKWEQWRRLLSDAENDRVGAVVSGEHPACFANICWKAVEAVADCAIPVDEQDAGAHRDRKVDAPMVVPEFDGAEDVVSAAWETDAVQRVCTHRKLLFGTPMAAPTQHRWLFLGA